jgi:RNA polymerase sigma factor (sigma-70 family)
MLSRSFPAHFLCSVLESAPVLMVETMTETEDAELLRRYATEGSETAFAEIVGRHLGLVYSVALRQVRGDAHLAEDVTQRVFGTLARKAGTLARHPVLAGWLYRTTHCTATDVRRSELRRRAREQEAQAQTGQEMFDATSETALDPERLRPVLDEVMGELGDRDRDAVMLRFFEGRSFSDMGRRLQLTEDATRMRVERALEKMHRLLARRGMTSTAIMLGTALAGQAAVPVSAGLAASVTGAALAGAAAGGGGAAIAAATFMSIGKLQLGFAAAVIVAGAGGLAWQQRANAALQRENGAFVGQDAELPELRRENRRLEETAKEVAAYRRDAVDVSRLRSEADTLVKRMRTASHVPATVGSAELKRVDSVDAGSPTEIYDSAQVDVQPELINSSNAKPAYPLDLRRAGITGQTLVSFVVDADGRTQEVRAVNSTHPDFASEAVGAVQRMRFTPGQKAGQPVNVLVRMPIKFTLAGGGASPTWF